MINYFLILLQHILGFIYLFCFLYGYFYDQTFFYLLGGIGSFIYISIQVRGQGSKEASILFFFFISLLFTENWYDGLFWAGAFFTSGQIFGVIAYISNYKSLIDITKYDKVSYIDIVYIFILLLVPLLISNF